MSFEYRPGDSSKIRGTTTCCMFHAPGRTTRLRHSLPAMWPILAMHRARILLSHAEPIDPQCNALIPPGCHGSGTWRDHPERHAAGQNRRPSRQATLQLSVVTFGQRWRVASLGKPLQVSSQGLVRRILHSACPGQSTCFRVRRIQLPIVIAVRRGLTDQ